MKNWIGVVLIICAICLGLGTSHAQNPKSKYGVGDVAPNFQGIDQFGNDFNLKQTLKKKPVVLMFYRGYWCPYCNRQLSQLEDSLGFIQERGGVVVAVTPEQPQGIEKTIEKTDASFLIIHDQDLKIMKQYGVDFTLSDETLRKYKKNNMMVSENNGSNGPNLPVPATYIINTDSRILYSFYDPDHRKRATVKKILENL